MKEDLRIDKGSPVPLYQQLREILEYSIRTGGLKPEESIPGENELCENYGLSRTTVRQTIGELLKDGMLYRKQSRGRAFVAPVIIRQSLLRLEGFFSEDMLTAGLRPHTTVVSVEIRFFEQIAIKLGLPVSTTFYRVERIHHGNGEPLALQTSYVPERICPELDKRDLSRSLFRYIEDSYQRQIIKAKQIISIRQANNRERDLMHLPHRLPLFNVNRISYADNEEPVEYYECLLRSDRYEFEMDLVLENQQLSRTEVSGINKKSEPKSALKIVRGG